MDLVFTHVGTVIDTSALVCLCTFLVNCFRRSCSPGVNHALLASLLRSSLNSIGRNMIDTSYLMMYLPRPLLIPVYYLAKGLCVCSHWLQEETFLMMT